MAESDILKLCARPLRLADLRRVYEGPVSVSIAPEALGAVREAHLVTARLAAADTPAASRRIFDVFNEPGSPPTDEALIKQFEDLHGRTSVEQLPQSTKKVAAE